MKIALLADIHANLTALEAVIADGRARGADCFIVAGDSITDGPDTTETLDCLGSLTERVIRGNREEYMLRCRAGEQALWSGHRQMAALLWTYGSLRPADFVAIERMPEQLSVGLGDGLSLRVVHGSPFSVSELLKPNEDMGPVERAALAVGESALVFGHNHMQWSGTVHGRLVVDPGSVGVHFNRECMAEYGMLTCAGGSLTVELLRVPYDFAALEKRLWQSGMMEAAPVWTKITWESVRAGKNYCLEFLNGARAAMAAEGLETGLIPDGIWNSAARKWWKEKGWGQCPA